MRILIVFAVLLTLAYSCSEDAPAPAIPSDPDRFVVDGIDTLTGLIAQGDYLLVRGNCLACHSANLITQQGATAAGWREMIHWMQEKQGLTDLGELEEPIVAYLATYYAPVETGRRRPLGEVEWYRLNTDQAD
ncbi:hypothetical protein LEM8419_00967 [Neolewinella maritima]|uniref:Cytochrome c domain-containing protein n=1 Tax=Neolewinella maritima TaxID=1383882 RepID=A0ABN8F608_9BACT|nr:hypothetical protein [Neolewinella maritima]CAH0999667.1 hypothetical protein LEM8419_00967 [Neolewinella maritima]